MYFLADFARTKGAKDKKPRKKPGVGTYAAAGLLGLGAGVGFRKLADRRLDNKIKRAVKTKVENAAENVSKGANIKKPRVDVDESVRKQAKESYEAQRLEKLANERKAKRAKAAEARKQQHSAYKQNIDRATKPQLALPAAGGTTGGKFGTERKARRTYKGYSRADYYDRPDLAPGGGGRFIAGKKGVTVQGKEKRPKAFRPMAMQGVLPIRGRTKTKYIRRYKTY